MVWRLTSAAAKLFQASLASAYSLRMAQRPLMKVSTTNYLKKVLSRRKIGKGVMFISLNVEPATPEAVVADIPTACTFAANRLCVAKHPAEHNLAGVRSVAWDVVSNKDLFGNSWSGFSNGPVCVAGKRERPAHLVLRRQSPSLAEWRDR